MFPRLIATLLCATMITACGSPSPTYRTLEDFSSLDLSSQSLVTLDSLPRAPKGFTASDVEALAQKLMKMAELGTYDEDVWNPGSQRAAIDLVLKDLEPPMRRSLDQAAVKQLDGRPWANLVGTVFANDVEVVGQPRMQRATWDVGIDDGGLEVRLQTKTFYHVRHRGRPSVIVATHTWGLTGPPATENYYPTPFFASEAAGADACAFVLDSLITPDQDETRYVADMKEVLGESPTQFIEPTGDGGDATAKACRDKKS